MNGTAILEEQYAKKIALAIDAAKPEMKLIFNMNDAVEKANDEKFDGKIVSIEGNVVTVRLHEKGGYSYSFFNDVDFDALYYYPDENGMFELEVRE